MRRIAAHIAFDGENYIQNPLIELAEDGQILSVQQFTPEKGEPSVTEFFSGLLTPAFINAHTHLELSYSHNVYSAGLGMSDFVNHVIQTRKVEGEPDEQRMKSVFRSIQAAGTVACADICNSSITYPIKEESGLKFRNFFEFFALSGDQAKKQLKIFHEIQADYPDSQPQASFHAPYSMSVDGLEHIKHLFSKAEVSSLHFRESQDELNLSNNDNSLVNFYKKINPDFQPAFSDGLWSETQGSYLKDLKTLLFIHNLYLNEVEIVELKRWTEKHGLKSGFVLCPRSNMNIHAVLPPVDLFRKHDLTLCLGTDSLLSVSNLSLLDEMKFLAEKYPSLSLSELLKMSSSNPASLLGFEKLGKIKPGMYPGINGIKMKNLRSDVLDQDAELIRLV